MTTKQPITMVVVGPLAAFVVLPLKPLAGDGCACRAITVEGIPSNGWLAA